MATYHLSVKSGSKGAALSHAKYISRTGAYEKRVADLVHIESINLPQWAKNEPDTFWRAADKFERKNGAVYREFEGALPNELSTEDQVRLTKEFAAFVAPGMPLTVAIHRPIAALGEVPQPHFHLMFNERIPDEYERNETAHFKRFNPKNPALGGCKKESGGKTRAEISAQIKDTRKVFCEITNRYLEEAGSPARVDHRSNRDRGIDSLPGLHLGYAGVIREKAGRT